MGVCVWVGVSINFHIEDEKCSLKTEALHIAFCYNPAIGLAYSPEEAIHCKKMFCNTNGMIII